MKPGRWSAALFGAALALHASPSPAQPITVYQGPELTESALIADLAPADPAELSRSVGVRRTHRSKHALNAANKPAAASVLITFETDSTAVSDAARTPLDVIGRALVSDRLKALSFAIEGHADPRGGEAYNRRLSQARAESVVAYLVQSHTIDRGRLRPIGRGSKELLDPKNPTAAENRRVTIRTLAPLAPPADRK